MTSFFFFLSYSPLIITPLCGPYPIRVIICLGHVRPSLLLFCRLSIIADDVVVAVLVIVFLVVVLRSKLYDVYARSVACLRRTNLFRLRFSLSLRGLVKICFFCSRWRVQSSKSCVRMILKRSCTLIATSAKNPFSTINIFLVSR